METLQHDIEIVLLTGSAAAAAYFLFSNKLLKSPKNPHLRKVAHGRDKVLVHLKKLKPLHAFFALGGWLLLRVIIGAGFVLTVEIVAVCGAINYVEKERQRARSEEIAKLQKLMESHEGAIKVLGQNLPEWVTYPSVSRSHWLDAMLTRMWPSIAAATEETIRTGLDKALQDNKPPFLTRLALSRCSMGNIPLRIHGVQNHEYTENSTILDFHVAWCGNPDFRIVAGVTPLVEPEVVVKDLQLHCVLRVVLGPHVPKFPCFANVKVSIVGETSINFVLKAAKLNMDMVPGLQPWLESFIRQTLVGLLTYPTQISVPIIQGYDSAGEQNADAVGLLNVTIHGLKKTKRAKLIESSFGVKLALLGDVKAHPQKTERVPGPDPVYNQTFAFTIYEPSAKLVMTAEEDSISKGALSMVGQVTGKGKTASVCVTVAVADLIKKDLTRSVLPLIDAGSNASSAQLGELEFSTEFFPFAAGKADNDSSAHGLALVPPSPPKRICQFHEGLTPPRTRSETHSSHGDSIRSLHSVQSSLGSRIGTLFLHIDRCNDLPNAERVGKSDPYVVVRLGTKTVTTSVVDSNLNPHFNFEGELEIHRLEDPLDVRVLDKNDFQKDTLLGGVSISLHDVKQSNGRLKHTWALKPKGTISMSLRLMLFQDEGRRAAERMKASTSQGLISANSSLTTERSQNNSATSLNQLSNTASPQAKVHASA